MMGPKAGPMREALKRKLEPPMDDMAAPAEQKPEAASPEGEVEGGSYDAALSSLDDCVQKLPPDKAMEAQDMIDKLRDLFKNYEEPSGPEETPEEGPPEAKGPVTAEI